LAELSDARYASIRTFLDGIKRSIQAQSAQTSKRTIADSELRSLRPISRINQRLPLEYNPGPLTLL
jgi:hypothetical protein